MQLVTNLHSVHLVDEEGKSLMYLHAHALVLAKADSITTVSKIRGFSHSGSTPVFDFTLDCDAYDYTVEKPEPFMKGAVPLNETWIWADGTRMSLGYSLRAIHEEDQRGLSIDDFPELVRADDGSYNSDEIYNGPDGVWSVLAKRVAAHWDAPFMPVTGFHDAKNVLLALENGAMA